jgi:hypothetical protein
MRIIQALVMLAAGLLLTSWVPHLLLREGNLSPGETKFVVLGARITRVMIVFVVVLHILTSLTG